MGLWLHRPRSSSPQPPSPGGLYGGHAWHIWASDGASARTSRVSTHPIGRAFLDDGSSYGVCDLLRRGHARGRSPAAGQGLRYDARESRVRPCVEGFQRPAFHRPSHGLRLRQQLQCEPFSSDPVFLLSFTDSLDCAELLDVGSAFHLPERDQRETWNCGVAHDVRTSVSIGFVSFFSRTKWCECANVRVF